MSGPSPIELRSFQVHAASSPFTRIDAPITLELTCHCPCGGFKAEQLTCALRYVADIAATKREVELPTGDTIQCTITVPQAGTPLVTIRIQFSNLLGSLSNIEKVYLLQVGTLEIGLTYRDGERSYQQTFRAVTQTKETASGTVISIMTPL